MSPLLKFVRRVHIDAPPDEVFAFHEHPDALRQLIPPWENMRPVESDGSLTVGSRVVLAGRVLKFVPVRWVAVHTEYDPPRLFADRQESGPFAYWYHRHRVEADGGGALLIDEVDYELPLGGMGRWFGDWLVRRQLEAMFAYRHETTKRVVEAGRMERAGQP
ncbi:MAG: SRPBCC family protein [Planctomycetaceae bacterium]